MRRLAAPSALLAVLAAPLSAQDLTPITDRDTFVERVAGRQMTTSGITVVAEPNGQITGGAFGADVTGSWSWEDGYFCREMSWTVRSWPMNCQAVFLGAGTVRFIADRGAGDTADLTIQ